MWIEHFYDLVKDSWTGFDNPSMCYVLDHQASDWWHFFIIFCWQMGCIFTPLPKPSIAFFEAWGALLWIIAEDHIHCTQIGSWPGFVPASFCDCSIKGVRVEHGHTSRKFRQCWNPIWDPKCFLGHSLLCRNKTFEASRITKFWWLKAILILGLI